jgi:hypothetical protein
MTTKVDEGLPFDPSVKEERYTATDAEDDPVRKEAAAASADNGNVARIREERILDIPVTFAVGDKKCQFTSRPMGFVKMALREFLAFANVLEGIQVSLDALVESEAKVSETDIQNIMLEKGDEGAATIFKLVQILLHPVTGRAPDLTQPVATLEEIEWGMSLVDIAALFNVFLERDLYTLGGTVKNLIGFSRMN